MTMEYTGMRTDVLTEISRAATLEASKALSRLVQAPVSLGALLTDLRFDVEFSLPIEPDERVYVVFMPVLGNTAGLATLCFPERAAHTLCDQLLSREPGSTRGVMSLEEDALGEVGNIIIGNFLRVLARALPEATFLHRAPRVFSKPAAELPAVFASLWQPAEAGRGLLFEMTFSFRQADLVGYAVIYLEAAPLNGLLPESLETV